MPGWGRPVFAPGRLRWPALVAPRNGGGWKRRCRPLAIGGAIIAVLLLYRVSFPQYQDLTDVFYPPVSIPSIPPSPELPDPADPVWLHVSPPPPIHPDRTIFLLETSGRSSLTPREWCAVESAARAHPDHTVLLLVSTPLLHPSPPAVSILALNNTRLARLKFASVFANTPLEAWYRSRVVLKSQWQASHMSDAVRFALLLKYGGIYLDTDVVVRRSMEDLPDGAGLESEHHIAAGVLKFTCRSPIPPLLASQFASAYEPGDWGANGPGVVTEVLMRGCGLRRPPLPAGGCGGYEIHGSSRFYGIPWPAWRRLLDPSEGATVYRQLEAAYAVHTWALHSRHQRAPEGSALHRLAEQHCPIALAGAEEF